MHAPGYAIAAKKDAVLGEDLTAWQSLSHASAAIVSSLVWCCSTRQEAALMIIERKLRLAIINEWVLKDEESTAQPMNGDDVGLECYALVLGQ
jgi:hypothetical protein